MYDDLLFRHITPTSSLCLQSETPHGLVLHCRILVSVPRQVTSSNRIGPAPLPKRGPNENGEDLTAVALFLKQIRNESRMVSSCMYSSHMV